MKDTKVEFRAGDPLQDPPSEDASAAMNRRLAGAAPELGKPATRKRLTSSDRGCSSPRHLALTPGQRL